MAVAAEQEKEVMTDKALTANQAATTKTDNQVDKEADNSQVASQTNEATDDTSSKRLISAPADLFKQQQQDINHYLTDNKVEPILVDTEEYLMQINPHSTAINKGVMILIPDWQQSLAGPSALNQLRDNMPSHGWTLLTIHPPHQPNDYPSQALTPEQRLEENQQSLKLYQTKLSAVISEMYKKAKNYPGAILTIAEGRQAALIVNMIQNELLEPTSAMIMLSSYLPTAAENNELAEYVALSDYPILDLHLKRDHRLALASAKHRKDRAKNEMKVYYRQRQLNNQITGQYPKHSLTREILGWLKSIGW